MKVEPISTTFSQRWDRFISVETEKSHETRALCYHVATIATVVSFVALAVIGALVFPGYASLLIFSAAVLCSPGVELAKLFLSRARESKKLEDQSCRVREYFNKFVQEKQSQPEIKALSYHWKEKAEAATKEYQEIYKEASSPDEDLSPFAIKISRIDALDAEKKSTTIKVYSLFLESFIGHQTKFEQAFCEYTENVSDAFQVFSSWDSRESETRAVDSKFANDDLLLTFRDRTIKPISYKEVHDESKHLELKARLFQAFTLAKKAS